MTKRVKRWFNGWFNYIPRLPEIIYAASLAHHGLLGSVLMMELRDVDLSSVPAEHLASLASIVTSWVNIREVSGCGLVTILESVKRIWLNIYSQSLGSEETQALVQAMESHVELVKLYRGVTLDIRVLMEYSGQERCKKVMCESDTARKYREQLRTWTLSRNWEVTDDHDDDSLFFIERM